MAVTIEEQPLTNTPVSAFGPVVFRLSAPSVSAPKFRYVCRVKDGAGNVLVILRCPPNAVDDGIFDLQRVIRDYLNHPLVLNAAAAPEYADERVTLTSLGYAPAGLFQVDLGSAAAPDMLTPPTTTYDHTNVKVNAVWFAGDEGDARWRGVTLKGTATASWRCVTAGATTGVGWLTEITPITETTQLGGVVLKQRCTKQDYRVHCFWYAANTGTGRSLGSTARTLKTSYYRTDTNVQVTETITLSSMVGVAATSVTTNEQMTAVAITAPGSFILNGDSGLHSLITAGYVTRYEMRLFDASNIACSYNLVTEVVDLDCYNGAPVTLGWINRAGGWDYFNFTKRREYSNEVTQSSYYKDAGTWQRAQDFQPFSDVEGGKTTFKSTGYRTANLTTDWVSDADAALLESLFASDAVFLARPDAVGAWTRVSVKDTSFTLKTALNDRLFKYSISVQYAKYRRNR
jgi:hypothetical protein